MADHTAGCPGMTGALMDQYRTWSDEALDEHRRAILTEQERRANLDSIPEQIEQLAKVYRDGGGEEQALTDALDPEQVSMLERA